MTENMLVGQKRYWD